MRYLTNTAIGNIAKEFGLTFAQVKSVVVVESGSQAFDEVTGKILIQFEPHWYKRITGYTPSGLWSVNKVEKQAAEWKAFNDAFAKNKKAAMESTSIGLMQVMGFHWKRLGFKSVDEMWDYAKASADNQLRLGLKFIQTNSKMFHALKTLDWKVFAFYYNGEQYKKFNYDTRLAAQYDKWSKQTIF